MTGALESRKIIAAPRVLLQDLNGEAVLLNLDNGQYYGLDGTSFRMYSLLVSMDSVQAAYDALLHEFDVESRQLQMDLDAFLNDLLENGLVLYADASMG